MSMPIAATMLDIVAATSGMGFAAITQVQGERFVMYGVRDSMEFGLREGESIGIEPPICREIEQHRNMVVIDDIEEDAIFINHYAPKFYGFRSYISAPIILEDGQFFGTLCALDSRPRKVDTPAMRMLFSGFSSLIAFHLDALNRMTRLSEALAHQESGETGRSKH